MLKAMNRENGIPLSKYQSAVF